MIQEFYEELSTKIKKSQRLAYRHYSDRRSYAELYDSMRRLNSLFSGRKGHRIAVYAEKSFNNYASIFSIVLSNNIWVSLNPNTPHNRNYEILFLVKPEVLLTDCPLPDDLLAAAKLIGTEILSFEEVMNAPAGPDFKISRFRKTDLAMIYFTSGSTGKPKGVPLTHENYIFNVRNILRIVNLEYGQVFADYHDLGFSISIPILFPCVLRESTLAPAIQKKDIMLPIRNLEENDVNVVITVPSTMARIRKMRHAGLQGHQIKTLMLCGEPLHLDLLSYIYEKLEIAEVYDFYGSTETASWVFYHKCSASDLYQFEAFSVVPIGKPITKNSALLRDDGELWLSGPQITPGYLGESSGDQFVKRRGKRWFKTGDKIIIHDGFYLCKGRLDAQVKIGGYRIELMDIEAHLRSIEDVDHAICLIDGEGFKKSIVAVVQANREIDLTEIRNHLRDWLPAHMIPRKSITVKELPINKSGKLDRIAVRENYKNGTFQQMKRSVLE